MKHQTSESVGLVDPGGESSGMNPGLSVDHPQLEALEWKAVIEHLSLVSNVKSEKTLRAFTSATLCIFKTVKC
jgi:hypothetical protein